MQLEPWSPPRDAFQGQVVRNLGGAIAGGVLIASIEFAVTRNTVPLALLAQAEWMMGLSVHWALAALPLGLTFLVVEFYALDGRPSRVSYAAGVALGAVVGAGIVALHGSFVDPAISRTAVGFDMTLTDRFLYGLWQLGFWGAVGATMHWTDLQRRISANALRRGEMARLRSERGMAEARLAAIQAQVEPEFVLATLGSIEQLYGRDLEAADRALDALIRFLRMAVPRLRQSTSTIGQEIDLLQAYADVLRAVPNGGVAVSLDVDLQTRAMKVPSGLFVSLIQRSVGPGGSGSIGLRLRVGRETPGRCLEVGVALADIHTDDAMREFVAFSGERLALLRGSGSSISILPDGPGTLTVRVHLGPSEGEDHVEIGSG